MEGTCKCGGRVKESNHEVKTPEGLKTWVEQEFTLPAKVEQSTCRSCERTRIRIFSEGQLVHVHG